MKFEIQEDGVAILKFQSTKSSVNAWDIQAIETFEKLINDFCTNDKIKGLIITSKENPMCAGADLTDLTPFTDV